MEITYDDALTIQKALVAANALFRQEFDKIANTPDASQFVIGAAHQQYNNLTENMTKLHIRLVEEFPDLTVGSHSVQ